MIGMDEPGYTRAERNAMLGYPTEPGLHKVGPEPWAYVFNPAKGQKLSFVSKDGRVFTGTVADFSEDEETVELKFLDQATVGGMLEFAEAVQKINADKAK